MNIYWLMTRVTGSYESKDFNWTSAKACGGKKTKKKTLVPNLWYQNAKGLFSPELQQWFIKELGILYILYNHKTNET